MGSNQTLAPITKKREKNIRFRCVREPQPLKCAGRIALASARDIQKSLDPFVNQGKKEKNVGEVKDLGTSKKEKSSSRPLKIKDT